MLALAAGVATHHVPFLAVMSLPILFAAGMCLMDTADGAFMSQAYGWAFSNPVRKVYYNITVTSLSVAVALLIGTIELLQVLARSSGSTAASGAGWTSSTSARSATSIVGLFVVTWARLGRVWKCAGSRSAGAPTSPTDRWAASRDRHSDQADGAAQEREPGRRLAEER